MAWKVRIEFVRHARESFQRGSGGAEPWRFYAAQTLTGSGSTAVASTGAPAFSTSEDGVQSGFARVSVISGAVVLAWGAGASSGELAGVRLQAGDRQDFEVATGDILSFVEAADAPVAASGGGGSGGPSTLTDGADTTQGATTDSVWGGSGAGTVVSVLKGAYARLAGTLSISAATLPLPTGAATSAKQDALVTALGAPLQAGGSVSVSNLPATQPVSASALPLPSGAATAALQSTLSGKLDQLHTDMTAATAAGENHIGEVGFAVGKAQAQFGPGSSTTYTSGQAMSAAIALSGMARVNGGKGYIVNSTLELAVANTAEVDLVFFSSAPSGSYAAGTTFTLNSADRVKLSKIIKLTDWTALGAADSLGEAVSAPKFFKCEDATSQTTLWVVPVARGSITLATVTDATLTLRTAQG